MQPELSSQFNTYSQLSALTGKRVGIVGVVCPVNKAGVKFCLAPGQIRLVGIRYGALWSLVAFDEYGLQEVLVDVFSQELIPGMSYQPVGYNAMLVHGDAHRAVQEFKDEVAIDTAVSFRGYLFKPYPAGSVPTPVSGVGVLQAYDVVDGLPVATICINRQEQTAFQLIPSVMYPAPGAAASGRDVDARLPTAIDAAPQPASPGISEAFLEECVKSKPLVYVSGTTAQGLGVSGSGTLSFWDKDSSDKTRAYVHFSHSSSTRPVIVLLAHIEKVEGS